MSKRSQRDAERILEKLRAEQVTCLYHFTSIENLAVIRDMNALCSKKTLEDAGRWPPPEPGGNDLSHSLDHRNGNWDMVPFNFTPHTPMAYLKKPTSHLCFFVVDVNVATEEGVVFTDSNAASTGNQQRAEGLAGLRLVNFRAIRAAPRPWDREGWVRPVQAEVLVPDRVPLAQVIKVGFVSQASLEEARRIWGNGPGPRFVLRPRYFSDNPTRISINFPRLGNVLLTDVSIDGSSVGQAREAKVRFSRRGCAEITLIADVFATAGVKAQMAWNPIGLVQEEEFDQTSQYLQWTSIPIQSLPNGRCSVEYRLGLVRWASLEFEVVR